MCIHHESGCQLTCARLFSICIPSSLFQYVQDALEEQSALLVDHLVRLRGHVFVCGSLAMGRAVKRTIAAALQEHATVSGIKSEREAKALVTQWLESGQIVTELW